MTRRGFFALVAAATVAPVRAAFMAQPVRLVCGARLAVRSAREGEWLVAEGEWLGLAS